METAQGWYNHSMVSPTYRVPSAFFAAILSLWVCLHMAVTGAALGTNICSGEGTCERAHEHANEPERPVLPSEGFP